LGGGETVPSAGISTKLNRATDFCESRPTTEKILARFSRC